MSDHKLPAEFESYVSGKLEGGAKGRPHLIKALGSMEKVLELFTDAWIQNFGAKELERKYKAGYYQIYRLLEDASAFKSQIVDYMQSMAEICPKGFNNYPSIQNWEAMIRRSGHLSQLQHIKQLEWILTGGKRNRGKKDNSKSQWIVEEYSCNPEKFDLTEAQKFIDAYLRKYKGTSAPKHFIMAIRNFLASRGQAIPRGFGAQYGLSGEKIGYGKHKFVKADNEEIEAVRAHLKDDIETLTFFDWGIESLSRAETLAKSPNNFKEHNGTVHSSAYESKTDSTFPKYLLLNIPHCNETWINVRNHMKGDYLFFEQEPKSTQIRIFLSRMCANLKAAYKTAGITEPYAYKKPIHFLRHTGAHLWLMRTNYDYGLVAALGWEDINTLRDCYGGLPPEILASKIEKLTEASA